MSLAESHAGQISCTVGVVSSPPEPRCLYAPCEPAARPTAIELCAGGGGQAIGISAAGFSHLALVELNPLACQTLRRNRRDWPVWNGDLRRFDATEFKSCDLTLVTGGVPCQPFTIAGEQRGLNDASVDTQNRQLIDTSKPAIS